MSDEDGGPPKLSSVGEPDWPYRVVRRLGSGTSASVWLAEDTERQRLVVLKIGHSLGERERLADEAEHLCTIGSPLLSEVLDAGITPSTKEAGDLPAGKPYVALTWFEGISLDEIGPLDADRRLALATVVARDIGEALADLHAAGTAHGDVKPANVILTRGDAVLASQAHLVDLGLSAPVGTERAIGGTPRYLPPEAFETTASANAKARDLWALGLTLAEILDPDLRHSESALVLERLRDSSALGGVIRALLSTSPAARPGAEWVAVRARALSGAVTSLPERRQRWQRAVKSSYLATRRHELARAAQGASLQISLTGSAGDWLAESHWRWQRIGELRGGTRHAEILTLDDLSSFDRQLWLIHLIKSPAARFPQLPEMSDSQLADRLLRLTETRDPRAIRFGDLLDAAEIPLDAAEIDPVTLAAELASPFPSRLVLDLAEASVATRDDEGALRRVLAAALRRRGDWAQALVQLDEIDDAASLATAAEISRRLGDRSGAVSRLDRLDRFSADPSGASGATRARLLFDVGEYEAARSLLETLPRNRASLEIRALLALQEGKHSAALSAAQATASGAKDAEEAARAESILGSVHHARGDVRSALTAFRRASEHANRAGVVVEEAVYCTNVAAAATDLGELAEALDAARRSILLFEHLGRAEGAARAALSLGSAYAVAGAVAEAEEWLDEAQARARAAGDRRCEAFVELVRADLPGLETEAMRHSARRAWELLEHAPSDDRLRAASRLLASGELPDLEPYDDLAKTAETATDARLDWWAARVTLQHRDPMPSPEPALAVLAEVNKLIHAPAALGCRGPSLAAAAALARRLGQGDIARRLLQAGLDCVKQLRAGAPEELRAAIATLPWVKQLQEPDESALLPEQVVDIENLVRSLGTRDRLRPLLDQALDALLLWTGVERGLLLLCAPGGKLVPRAARNLARADIAGEQLRLSASLAERALQSREPVVAVDASGELSEIPRSVHNLGLRSVLAVPLLAHGEPLGVVYLDDRTRRGAFGPAELGWVRLIATLAAVAIADARAQLELRRAVRRARRAEQRSAALLAAREGDLEVAQRELARAKGRGTRFEYDAIIGKSRAVSEMLALVDRVTASDIPVLLHGESGSGKELIARAIHQNGARGRRAFVSENCASIPEGLLESTLFGHTRGAFTGATHARAGLFEIANGGTLFLDEIGEMSLGMQAKLLRALETGEIHPVGAERSRKVDVRIIAATHRDLERMVQQQAFRKDLYYRLNVITVRVPPLRERREDIPLLLEHFFQKHKTGSVPRLSPRAWDRVIGYDWPGNVRELENEARRLLVLSDGLVDVEQLSPLLRAPAGAARPLHELDLRAHLERLETELLIRALDRTDGNQTRSAELLGVSRFGLQKMLKRLNIDVQSLRAGRAAGTELTEGQ